MTEKERLKEESRSQESEFKITEEYASSKICGDLLRLIGTYGDS